MRNFETLTYSLIEEEIDVEEKGVSFKNV